MRLAVVGTGAFGIKHLDALARIVGVDVAAVASRRLEQAQEVAATYGIEVATDSFDDVLAMDDLDAVILATPTQLHAAQAVATLEAGKHVQVEIPLADNLVGALAVVEAQERTGLVAMVGHTRRFNPSHQWIHHRVTSGAFALQQLDVQTYFFRRTNTNALGQPRSWTDNLLWHHAAHTVDLFRYQCGAAIEHANALAGPLHPELAIPMDMSIQLKSTAGQLCTLSLSFNNEGPFGTFFRYIGDTGTYLARYDELTNGRDEPIDVSAVAISMDGIELQDREFVAAIEQGREPNASVHQVLECYRVLEDLSSQL